ncbi:MAG: Na+/H+ antiporter subunit E [Chloroflexota bacterium]
MLTSLDPGDVVVGLALGLAIVLGLRARAVDHAEHAPLPAIARAFGGMVAGTLREMVVGSWRVARFCLGDEAAPGFVEVPRGERSHRGVAPGACSPAKRPTSTRWTWTTSGGAGGPSRSTPAMPMPSGSATASARERTQRHLVP